ncbi:MAG: alpha/beta hydrolase [Chloroflexi bacterium]|mgnify:FL=1|nr:MAG: alpha/beta hydrolase [Chloroflexota bacterium]
MTYESDYAALDRPELVQFVFYPRKFATEPPRGASDHVVPVADAVSISCRFYAHRLDSPTILFFHGNGEVVSDYDYIAPMYHGIGANLFVADYRGYGASTGSPSFSTMVADSHRIFEAFLEVLRQGRYSGPVFVKGRSLGSVSAIELAAAHPDRMHGLIVESGFASTPRLMARLGFPAERLGIRDFGFPNLTKIRTVTVPTLIIHGEYDSIIPLEEGKDLYENVATERKRLVIIPNADHNDILVRDTALYFGALQEFVSGR